MSKYVLDKRTAQVCCPRRVKLSYLADLESLGSLLQHLGDSSPWTQIFTVIAEGLNKEHPRAPVALWKDVDPECRNLSRGDDEY